MTEASRKLHGYHRSCDHGDGEEGGSLSEQIELIDFDGCAMWRCLLHGTSRCWSSALLRAEGSEVPQSITPGRARDREPLCPPALRRSIYSRKGTKLAIGPRASATLTDVLRRRLLPFAGFCRFSIAMTLDMALDEIHLEGVRPRTLTRAPRRRF